MKQKLLIVAHHMTIGGVQKSLVTASKALDYDKYDVTLYLRKNRTELLPFVDKRIHVIINKDPNHYYRKPYAIALQIKTLLARILGNNTNEKELNKLLADKIRKDSMEYEHKTYFSKNHYDIAIAYVQGFTAEFVAKYINADKKIVFFHTSTDDHHDLHKRILPSFNRIAALHDEQKSLLCEWHPFIRNGISIVENYSDKELITKQSKEFSIPETDKIVFCSCGRFAPVKGFDMAVEAAKILKDNNIEFVWYFVGDGPERINLEKKIAEYGLEKNIVITGMQKNPYPYMAASDVYVQPSYEEAMPVTIIEAHRLNKPVITTATVGGQKLVKNDANGTVCEINPEAVAKSIINLIDNKEKYDEIINNLKSTDYSHEFDKYKEQWKKLLEG